MTTLVVLSMSAAATVKRTDTDPAVPPTHHPVALLEPGSRAANEIGNLHRGPRLTSEQIALDTKHRL